MTEPIPIKGQGGYARKVVDTAAERDRLKAANVELAAALEAYTKDDPSGDGYRPNRLSQQKKWGRAVNARAALAKARDLTS